MVVTWIVAVGLIVFAQMATRRMTQVPGGAQNFLEWLVESSLRPAREHHRPAPGRAHVLVLCHHLHLHPGRQLVRSDSRRRHDRLGASHRRRASSSSNRSFAGANADLNMTLAMSLVFFALLDRAGRSRKWESAVWPTSCSAPKGDTAGVMKVLMIVVFFAAGCLEIISILFRPVSLSFRLYGNVFAGENMLETMATIVPGLGWLLPIPFYFMELLVGLVQAMVFMLLTAVFTLLICQPRGSRARGRARLTRWRRLCRDHSERRKDKQDDRESTRRPCRSWRGHRRRVDWPGSIGSGGTKSRRVDEDHGAVDSGHCLR